MHYAVEQTPPSPTFIQKKVANCTEVLNILPELVSSAGMEPFVGLNRVRGVSMALIIVETMQRAVAVRSKRRDTSVTFVSLRRVRIDLMLMRFWIFCIAYVEHHGVERTKQKKHQGETRTLHEDVSTLISM